MPRLNYHVAIADQPSSPGPAYQDIYPVRLPNGRHLELPIQPLPGDEMGIALLMSNQTPFAVERELGDLLVQLARSYAPDVVAGIPTLGLDYARLVASGLSFDDYVALGNSRKFWYDDALSAPVVSVTSPGASKKLYLDPALVSRVQGKRVLVVDDVINTGGSAVAALQVLQRAGADIVGLAVVLIEGAAWKKELEPFGPRWSERVRGLGHIPIFARTPAGWTPMPDQS